VSQFVHLHVHSEFSALDGICRAPEMIETVKGLGQPAVAITDHGYLAGVPEFYQEAKKGGIVPVLGQEFYIVPDASNKDKGDPLATNRHVVMMALDLKGWHAMVELSSIANSRDLYHFKPRIDHAVIDTYKSAFKHIAVTSACLSGEIARALQMSDNEKNAERLLKQYAKVFPNFYLEVQRHPSLKKYREDKTSKAGREEAEFQKLQRELNNFLIRMSKKHDVPLLITNDAHYIKKEHGVIHDLALAMQTGKDVDDEDRFRFNGSGYYLKSTAEMKHEWADKPEVWKSSQRSIKEIVKKAAAVKVPEFESSTWHIPMIPGQEQDPIEYLREKCYQRLMDLQLDGDPVYVERLEMELGVIREANFEQIFVIVEDYVNWARNKGIIVGPGRGSMVGTITSFLLGITLIDPVKYKLLFERAINPARPSIPDFDIDFEPDRCEEVIDYVKQRYGEENVMLIGTHLHMAPRQTIKGVLKAHKVPFQEANAITSELPDTIEITNNKATSDMETLFDDYANDHLKKLVKQNPLIRSAAVVLQGMTKSFGKHAAGVVISDHRRPLKDEVPLMLIPTSNTVVSQFDMNGVKKLHLVKFDFLRLSTLSMIAKAHQYIGFNPLLGEDNYSEFNDPAVYKMMAKGDLLTVFQYQGGAAKQCIMAMGVDNFEDIVAVNAIARPGSIKFLDQYVANKQNPKKIDYACKEVKPILEYTYGIILYQEQVMEIVKVLAGWDDLGADRIKEAIKSKSGKEFDEMKGEFLAGCKKNGISTTAASAVWAAIDDYRSYGFNRAHAVAYSAIGYETAYLLRHYPLEWLTAVLNTDDKKNFEEVMELIRLRGFKTKLPDVNKSDLTFTLEKGGIRFGLTQIAGIAEKTANIIINERKRKGPYKSYKDFVKRMEGTAIRNVARMKALEESGALNSLGKRADPADEPKYLGTYVSKYPLEGYQEQFDELINSKSNRKLLDGSRDSDVIWGGLVKKIKTHKTKKGDEMAFIGISYFGEQKDVVMFPRQWEYYRGKIDKDSVVLLNGTLQPTRGGSILCEAMRILETNNAA